jgi:hypothetical protein
MASGPAVSSKAPDFRLIRDDGSAVAGRKLSPHPS